MIKEYIIYTLKENCSESFDDIMHELSIPLHNKYQIDIVKSSCSANDDEKYILVRSFESYEAMNIMLEKFYQTSDWKNIRNKIVSKIIKTEKIAVNE